MWKVAVAFAGLLAISMSPPPGTEILWWAFAVLLAVGGITMTVGALLDTYTGR